MLIVASGFIVGVLMGLTGMGGGLIMTPLLIFGFGIPASTAIGTDLIYASVTKVFGSLQHWRQRTVNWLCVRRLLVGSVPGSLCGIWVIHWLSRYSQLNVDSLLRHLLGWTFVLIAIVMVYKVVWRKREERLPDTTPSNMAMVLLGFFGGLLVTLTSVGSGTLFMAFLTMLTAMRASKLVGTDLVHGAILTFVAGLGHLAIGTVDLGLAALLLLGSIPGILLGSKLSLQLPDSYVRWCLVTMLMVSGIKLVGG